MQNITNTLLLSLATSDLLLIPVCVPVKVGTFLSPHPLPAQLYLC